MKILLCLLALLATVFAYGQDYDYSFTDVTSFKWNLKAAAKSNDEFPAWNPKEIEGWDKMTPAEQKEVKEFYDSLKELYDALDALDKELDKLDSPKDKPAVKPAAPAAGKTPSPRGL